MPRPILHFLFAFVPTLAFAQVPAAASATAPAAGNLRVSAHVLLLDRAAAVRAGLEVLQVGDGRLRVARRGESGVAFRGDVAGLPVTAFVNLARERRLLRSESRMHVVVASGSRGRIAALALGVDRRGGVHEAGPELDVVPTLLADGGIRLDVSAGLRDVRHGAYGSIADGAPVRATTTLIVRAGAPATVGTVSVATERRDAGLLHWRREREGTDAVIVLVAELLPR